MADFITFELSSAAFGNNYINIVDSYGIIHLDLM